LRLRADYHAVVAPTTPSRATQKKSEEGAGALRALVVSGLLLALPGGLLPLWAYHIQADFARAGNYFAALGAGIALGGYLTRRWGRRFASTRILSYACFMAAAALILLAFAAPPAPFATGLLALLLAGAAAGALNAGLLQVIGPAWQANPAAIALTGGIYFAAGSAVASILLAWCFEGPNGPRLVIMLALVPALAGISILKRARGASMAFPGLEATPPEASGGRSVLAILFTLLLIFQFANEWSIAGWLPIFLIDRLGISPRAAVDLLALYWFALAAGRVGATRLLRYVRHGVLLAASSFCALFGCAALLAANTRFGTIIAILLAGMGFSAIYPLASEKISARFSFYHPGYFNGIFTYALPGALLAPFALGYGAASMGLRIVPIAAMFGSCAVLILLLVIWLGHKVSGE
jgi:hypothetical protein